MYEVKPTKQFKKDVLRAKKRGYNLTLLNKTIKLIASGSPLPPSYRNHPLKGDYAGCQECHITPDWLLVYELYEDELILYLTRTGTHSDLF